MNKKQAEPQKPAKPKKTAWQRSWDVVFGKLMEFKKRHGHCNVPAYWQEDRVLGAWVSSQRRQRASGMLTSERFAKLDALGFIWNWQAVRAEQHWMEQYGLLVEYVKRNGHPHVPKSFSKGHLGSWVWIQRQRRRGKHKSLLTHRQISLLDKLCFRWDAREDVWQEHFEQLALSEKKHEHIRIGKKTTGAAPSAGWINKQRAQYAKGTLPADRKAKLDSIGFKWRKRTRS